MTEVKKEPSILWCDIETTGRDATTGLVLEVGLRLTDWYGAEIRRWTSIIWDYRWRATLAANPLVWDMHTESGLIADLTRIESLPSIRRNLYLDRNVIPRALDWLTRYASDGPHDGKFPMAGNSLSGVDRPFLKRYAPEIHDFFSYRNLDVSSIREACRIVNPPLHAREPQVEKAHRPQDDIDNSITLWKHYIDNFLFEE